MRDFDRIPFFDLVMCLAKMSDLVHPTVYGHKLQVAYVAYRIAKEYGLEEPEVQELLVAGALHDLGALSLGERLAALRFDVDNPHRHAEYGYHLLRMFAPLARPAELIRFHHVRWAWGAGGESGGRPVPLGGHLLHLADRVAVLLGSPDSVLLRADDIRDRIAKERGTMFHPDLVDAFAACAAREYFWLDAACTSIDRLVTELADPAMLRLSNDDLVAFTDIVRRVIDWRCRFTATHSAGVAAVAETLALAVGFSPSECLTMRVAGYLHDIGKLSIAPEILLKPSALTPEEFAEVRRHTYYSHRLLGAVRGFETVNVWASYHHEKLDGTGYPFHIGADDLPLGARIMAVADVFTAVTEDRPYRQGMEGRAALAVLNGMAEQAKLDAGVVRLLRERFDAVNDARVAAQRHARDEFERIEGELGHDERLPDVALRVLV